MSYHPNYSYPPQREMLLDDITKAFKEVTHICKLYFDSRKISPTPIRQPTQHNRQPTQHNRQPTQHNRQPSHQNNRQMTQSNQHINFNNYKGNLEPKSNIFERINSFNVDADSEQSDQPLKTKKIEIKGKQYKNMIKPQIKPSSPLSSNIPPPPKAPLSPYFIFYKEKKDVIKGEFPEMSVTEITTAAGKVWKSLSEQEKKPFNNKFFEEKEKYDGQMKEYVRKYPNYKEIYKKVIPTTNNMKK